MAAGPRELFAAVITVVVCCCTVQGAEGRRMELLHVDRKSKPTVQRTVSRPSAPVAKSPQNGAFRSPESISAMTRGGDSYGDRETEATVLQILWWLKGTQKVAPGRPEQGYWSGGASSLANTALAVLAFLAHGEYPGSNSPFEPDFGPVVERAVGYLVASVQPGDTIRMKGSDGNEYAFLMATYALCEAYGMTKDPDCGEAARLCLNRIVRGQSPTGGWDYKMNPASTRDDLSYAGWALQAIKAGKMAGVKVEGLDACLTKAVRGMKTRNFKNGGFSYVAGGNPTGLTATGCFIMQFLGYGREPEVAQALDYMREWTPSFEARTLATKSPGSAPQYYCYYATQCKFQAGMRLGAASKDEMAWRRWNAAMKKLFASSIQTLPDPVRDMQGREHRQGYVVNRDAHTSRPVMDSCLAALQLMVYYRYRPTAPGRTDVFDVPPPKPRPSAEPNPSLPEEDVSHPPSARDAGNAFSLDSFMGFAFGTEFGASVAAAANFEPLRVGRGNIHGDLLTIADVDEDSLGIARVEQRGRLRRPFRKFSEVRVWGRQGGALCAVELSCASDAFSTKALRLEELAKVCDLLSRKYGISFTRESGLARFRNDNVTITVRDEGELVLTVISRKVLNQEKIRAAQERRKSEDRERVGADVGSDML